MLLAVSATVVAAACTTQAHHDEQPMASAVTIADQWVSSAQTGMAAVFGTFTNTGHHDARVVKGTSGVAGRVEVHELAAGATGVKTMRPKEGGMTIPADGSHALTPTPATFAILPGAHPGGYLGQPLLA